MIIFSQRTHIMKHFRHIAFALGLTVMAILDPGHADAHEIKIGNLVIHHPWAKTAPGKSDVAAGFMKITNTGTEDDRLLKATAEVTPTVQLHNMKMDGDVMKMFEMTEGIVIPAGQTVELKPMSLHVMFMNLKSSPIEGEELKGTLTFEKAGTAVVDYEVSKSGAEAQ
jgi:periplasmic copper chaperone A